MLKQRIITAVLLAPILLALVIYGQTWGFAALIAIIQLAATWEWLKINQLPAGLAAINAITLTALTAVLIFVWPTAPQHWIIVYAVVWLLAVIWLMNHRWGYDNRPQQTVIKGLLGVVAIMLFAISINQLHEMDRGPWLTLVLFFLIWVADIGAYASGKTLGKHKLAINISPGKTWEGVIGAMIFVGLYAAIISHYLGWVWWQAMLLMMPIALFSVVGDLAASLGKRQAGVKDSSQLLPGHGGFIDRFDSLIAAAPLFAYFLPHIQ
ncbi:phosphatidate cytidylyltransferase [Marinicella meishanensis]|uniref:phosphatidate cytidylyltransferase n=1 Tax=Marinicella meishanensis TaxID=2873263 RepID=UPI001CBCA952|nr:phosphatidate cytidylyltransferase [Marinicella sp. NBU2979]